MQFFTVSRCAWNPTENITLLQDWSRCTSQTCLLFGLSTAAVNTSLMFFWKAIIVLLFKCQISQLMRNNVKGSLLFPPIKSVSVSQGKNAPKRREETDWILKLQMRQMWLGLLHEGASKGSQKKRVRSEMSVNENERKRQRGIEFCWVWEWLRMDKQKEGGKDGKTEKERWWKWVSEWEMGREV